MFWPFKKKIPKVIICKKCNDTGYEHFCGMGACCELPCKYCPMGKVKAFSDERISKIAKSYG
jgi:hypothetical protein